jgi:hypothetical protein
MVVYCGWLLFWSQSNTGVARIFFLFFPVSPNLKNVKQGVHVQIPQKRVFPVADSNVAISRFCQSMYSEQDVQSDWNLRHLLPPVRPGLTSLFSLLNVFVATHNVSPSVFSFPLNKSSWINCQSHEERPLVSEAFERSSNHAEPCLKRVNRISQRRARNRGLPVFTSCPTKRKVSAWISIAGTWYRIPVS